MNIHLPSIEPTVTRATLANAVRALAMDAVEQAKSGHPGMPMGIADAATVLFTQFLKFDPSKPDWPDRDRFVLSAGHGSMLLYALLHLTGYEHVTLDELKRFRQLGSLTPGHPENFVTRGVETTTGPLGQGITTAVGMALTERMLNARYGDSLVDHYTYVIAGDGCLMEGISHEAIDFAGHVGLGRLIVLWDDNGISIDGPTSLSTSTDQIARFAASGWHVQSVNGHAPDEVEEAIRLAQATHRPSLIACRTVIGYGAPNRQGTEAVHGAPLGAAEIAGARERLGWSHPPFEIPDAILAAWRRAGERGRALREQWEARLAEAPTRADFLNALSGEVPDVVYERLHEHKRALVEAKPSVATRKASEMALAIVNGATDLTIGGSADLTHSNLTITPNLDSVQKDRFGGRYIRYGVREHGMAAAMNGIALHGGFIPYGGTFLVFSDYARGAIRLSALMGLRVIYVLTHDSIGLGEDGPTHQPIEHLAMLRATPNLYVFRPADAVETAECWEIALQSRETPSVLCLSRQNLPTIRTQKSNENLCTRGGYVLRNGEGARDVTLLATGSEVEIALAAADRLAGEGLNAAVVSMPSWELFETQDETYRSRVLGKAPRIAIEAAARFGWDRWIGEGGSFVGMQGFGASAPASDLYCHFGITADAVVDAALRTMERAR
ncbi:transketolase [Microvirga massiliensis]|uniref:transketolase n=1 Tax=Microvirga massiliensis TaxID=1033741 RepID=UPI00062B66A9|nr:transketolase [Microvirga massiliensis]